MSSPSNSVDRPEAADSGTTGSIQSIACNGCRKAKLKCSRDRPTCGNCVRIGHACIYETKRVKPGIKAGAIENIHRRLDDLESRFIEQQDGYSRSSRPDTHNDSSPHGGDAAHGVLALLARELPKLLAPSSAGRPRSSETGPTSNKRRRLQEDERTDAFPDASGKPPFPSSELTKLIIDIYFTHVHPWIPMLNQDRFRQRVDDPVELPLMEIIVHAMHITVARYLDEGDTMPSEWPADRIRRWVIITAMETLSIENLQALIIVAYYEIGNGNASRAWSIVASLSRTVEYLQITFDPEEGENQPMNRPFSYLPPPKDWADQEERRRVFWNVFLLDRFGSITMGWNTSLTSIDVHQRLPCDGILWRKQETVTTPYLGIWDKSTGGMGNMSPMSARRHDADPTGDEIDRRGSRNGSFPAPRSSDTDVSRIGAFAYCVEATESMSRVVTYFLQQRIDPTNTEEVTAWLARFKELDLRLVHWKMFLPQKWKSNVPRQASRMDPNLTLAHVTHNASTILLHQLIAYPPLSWPFRTRLPSVWSAETCCLAGMEISTITKKYLENTPQSLPLASSFAFCVYIAARVMLIHWRHDTQNRHLDEFWSLTHSLEEMSRRWSGPSIGPEAQRRDISAKYAWRLRDLHRRCMRDKHYRIHVMDYTQEIDHSVSFVPPRRRYSGGLGMPVSVIPQDSVETQPQWQHTPNTTPATMSRGTAVSGEAQQSGQPALPYQQYGMGATPMAPHSQTPQGLHAPNDAEMNRQIATSEYLVDMDRVIAFNDGSMFTVDMGHGVW